MKNTARYFPLFLILLLLVTSCGSMEPVQITGVKNIGLSGAGKDGIRMKVSLGVNNPNNMRIRIKKADLDVLVNNNKIGKLDIANPVVIQKNSNEDLEMEVVLKGDEILKGGAGALLSTLLSQKIKVRLSGNVKAKAFGIGKKIPVDFTHDVKLPDLR